MTQEEKQAHWAAIINESWQRQAKARTRLRQLLKTRDKDAALNAVKEEWFSDGDMSDSNEAEQ